VHRFGVRNYCIDDLWIRDTGAIFVLNEAGEKVAIDFNFNGWGNKQTHANDVKVASFIAKQGNALSVTTLTSLQDIRRSF
jgi:agmatine deiminase